MAGYSSTPLVKKLGIKPGMTLYVRNAPCDYAELLGGLPAACKLRQRLGKGLDCAHLFTRSRAELAAFLPRAKSAIMPDGMVWVSWPKRASGVASEVTEDVIRELCLPMNLVDIKVCAVDATWSGLKLVVRRGFRN